MLDSFTAWSLASNGVQLVQFGCTLAAKAQEVHLSNPGTSEETLEMETVTPRLLGTVHGIDNHLVFNGAFYFSRVDFKVISTFTGDCRRLLMVAEDSLGRLDAMKTHQPSSIWAGVRQELNIMWTKDEVEALMKRVHIRA